MTDYQMQRRIGERLRNRRLSLRKKQTVVAGLAGITSDYLYQLERGKKLPTLPVLVTLARVLQVPLDHLTNEDAVAVARPPTHHDDDLCLALTYPQAADLPYVDATALQQQVRGHIQLGIQLLSDGAGEVRRGLAGSLAESALLGARLAFFDMRQVALAERCFEIATTAMRESGDHALAAIVYAHWSFVPGFAGDGAAAQPLLDAAAGHARYAAGPLLRAWLHCVHSEVSARTGAPAQSVRHARQAEDSLSTRGEDPEWLDFFDPGPPGQLPRF